MLITNSINMTTIIPFQWSYLVIAITTITSIVFAISLYLIMFISKYPIWFKLLFSSICTFGILFGVYYTPVSIKVNRQFIIINHLIKKTIITKDSITNIIPLPNNIINESQRNFGSGGCFGYLGTYNNNKLGKFQLYATDKNDLIFIKTKSTNYLINCKTPNVLEQYGYKLH